MTREHVSGITAIFLLILFIYIISTIINKSDQKSISTVPEGPNLAKDSQYSLLAIDSLLDIVGLPNRKRKGLLYINHTMLSDVKSRTSKCFKVKIKQNWIDMFIVLDVYKTGEINDFVIYKNTCEPNSYPIRLLDNDYLSGFSKTYVVTYKK